MTPTLHSSLRRVDTFPVSELPLPWFLRKNALVRAWCTRRWPGGTTFWAT